MIVKVATKELQVGMFVSDVSRGWLHHPWKTKSRLLSNQDEIQELLEFGITEVFVDTEKSVHQAKGENVASAAQSSNVDPSKQVKSPFRSGPISDAELEMPRAAKSYTRALDTSRALVAACRMNKKIDLTEVKASVYELVESVNRNQDTLLALMKLRTFDDYTYTHSLNVSVLTISVGRRLGLSDEELRTLGLGAMLHDLGKSRVPGYILNKPSKLTDDEYLVMRDHASLSARVIEEQKLDVPDLVVKIAKHHHERMDGSGYPDHLAGEDIPLLVTICAISDVYDALTSDRVYHKGRAPSDALKIIYGLRGAHFPPEWVDRFVQSVGIYPPGSVVEMADGRVAVVMASNPEALSSPLIKLVADPDGQFYSRPKLVDLLEKQGQDDWAIERVISKFDCGFEPSYYFKVPKSRMTKR